MGNIKFIFSNIGAHDLKKKHSHHDDALAYKKQGRRPEKRKEDNKKDVPLFYIPRIRAARYEYF